MPTARRLPNAKHLAGRKLQISPRGEVLEAEDPVEILPGAMLGDGLNLTGGIEFRTSNPLVRPAERRAYARAKLRLATRILRIAGRRVEDPDTLYSVDISSSGALVRCPFALEVDTPVDLEIELMKHAGRYGQVQMLTVAHVVREQSDARQGWYGLAFSFDDITFERHEPAPPRFAA
jgi:PilZ domain